MSLPRKTNPGVKTFVQNKGLGQWLIYLYQFVSFGDSCQSQQAIGPTHLASELEKEESEEKGAMKKN